MNLRIMPKENIILSLNIKLERNIVGFKLVFLFVLAVKPKWFGHTPRVLAMPGWMLLLGLKRLCSKVGWLFSCIKHPTGFQNNLYQRIYWWFHNWMENRFYFKNLWYSTMVNYMLEVRIYFELYKYNGFLVWKPIE